MKKSFTTSNAWMPSSSVRDYFISLQYLGSAHALGVQPLTRRPPFLLSAAGKVLFTDLSTTLRGTEVQDVALLSSRRRIF